MRTLEETEFLHDMFVVHPVDEKSKPQLFIEEILARF
jgi:hypothetical protein